MSVWRCPTKWNGWVRRPGAGYSSKRLLLYVVLSCIAGAIGIAGAMLQSVNGMSDVLLMREVSHLLTAIETGPAQFANLNSRDFAERQLRTLMDRVQSESPHFVSAMISSGEGEDATYAE